MKTKRFRLNSVISILLIVLFVAPFLGIPKIQSTNPGGFATAINGPNTNPMTFNVTLNGRGATFPAPFLTRATTEYHGNYSNVVVNYNVNVPATGSGAGQKAFMNKTDSFDASDAPLSTAQRPLTPGVLHIPETIGSVTLSYNLPGINSNLNLTGDLIAKIYLGNITNWNDPALQSINPGVILPNHVIITVHRQDSSGTTFVFTSFLSQDDLQWAKGVGASTAVNWPGSQTGSPPPIYLLGNGNAGVASAISGAQYSIGYVELNYAISNGFTYGKIRNPTGTYVYPTLQTTTYAVNNATSALPAGYQDWSHVSMLNQAGTQTYPIASFTYILVYQNLNVLPQMDNNETFQAQALINFLYWLVNNQGQSVAPGLSYVPLPMAVRAIDNASIASITFGLPSAKISRTIHLSVGATGGWNATTSNPNPTITIYSGDKVNMILTSTDGAPHQWFIDYNNNGSPDLVEMNTSSIPFSSTSPTTSPTITPAIGINVPAAGTYTYRDADNSANAGTIQIIQQQLGVVIPEPAALTSSINKIDSSIVSTAGTLVINMRANTFSGNVSEIAVTSSGAITFGKNYTLTNLVLHSIPSSSGVQDRFALNDNVLPYALSTVINIQITGTTATLTDFLVREVDMAANGFVSIIDVSIVFSDYGASMGSTGYNPQADITNAGSVNIIDASVIAASFGDLVFR